MPTTTRKLEVSKPRKLEVSKPRKLEASKPKASRGAAFALAAGLTLAPGAGAQVYRWTDSAGKTHYGDKAPDDVKTQEVKINVQSFDGPPQIDDWAAIIRRPAVEATRSMGNTQGLTMYSATWCGPCKRAKAHMAKSGITYRDVDIDASDANRAEFKSYGGGGVPLFITGKRRMRGFSAEGLDRLLAESGR